MTVLRNPDHVTIAVANATTAIEFFGLLGFRKQRVEMIDGGPPARYIGSRRLRFFEGPEEISFELVEWVDSDRNQAVV